MPVAGHALRHDAPVLQGLEQGATWFTVVLAVAEAAMPEQVAELDETGLDVVSRHVPQAELTDAGRVDQVAAAGKMEQSRGGGGMGALPVTVERSPTRVSTPGNKAFTSDDLPADCPTKTLT